MSINLLETINETISEDVIKTLSGFLGESSSQTTSALSNAIPSILAGLVHKGSDSDGAKPLFDLLSQGQHDGSMLNDLVSAFSGGEDTTKLLSTGASLLGTVFGDKAASIANLVANASGINKNASTSLLGLLTPLIFGVLGKTVKAQGIGSAAGLASLLASQSGFLKNFLPAGLTSILGMAPLSDIARPVVNRPIIVDEDESGGFGAWLPWLLLPAILALGWGLLKYFQLPKLTLPDTSIEQTATPATPSASITESSDVDASSVASSEDETLANNAATESATSKNLTPDRAESNTTLTTPEAEETSPAIKTPDVAIPAVTTPVVEKVSNFFEKTLSSGFSIKASKNGIENKLIGFLEDSGRQVSKDQWFTMDGIIFDSGKSALNPASTVQINNIIQIMKAFPKVTIKIGGYTDNTGNAKANQVLSKARAEAVKAALAAGGIKSVRIDAEGYGSENPVADNSTTEGRQQNRRIDVRVTAK